MEFASCHFSVAYSFEVDFWNICVHQYIDRNFTSLRFAIDDRCHWPLCQIPLNNGAFVLGVLEFFPSDITSV